MLDLFARKLLLNPLQLLHRDIDGKHFVNVGVQPLANRQVGFFRAAQISAPVLLACGQQTIFVQRQIERHRIVTGQRRPWRAPFLRAQSQRIFDVPAAIATEAAIDSFHTRGVLHRLVQAFVARAEIADWATFGPQQTNTEWIAAQRPLHQRNHVALFVQGLPTIRLPTQPAAVFAPGVALKGRGVIEANQGLIPNPP